MVGIVDYSVPNAKIKWPALLGTSNCEILLILIALPNIGYGSTSLTSGLMEPF